MTRTDRFESMAAFLAEKDRLARQREVHAQRIGQHWEALKNKEVRRNLADSAVRDLLGLWKPTRLLSELLTPGAIGSSLGLAFASGKGGWAKRAGLFALGLLAPKLLERLNQLSIEDILHEVGVSAERVRDHLRSRERAPAAPSEAHDGTDD